MTTSTTGQPAHLQLPLASALTLALECWRLKRVAAAFQVYNEGFAIAHAVREISAILEPLGITVLDYTGRAYDPGMAPEVVEATEDPTLPPGFSIVEETISPTIVHNGKIVVQGQIVVRHNGMTASPAIPTGHPDQLTQTASEEKP
jgi:hypothetical protein